MKNSSLNINIKSLLDWKAVLLIIFILVIVFMQCNQSNSNSKDTIVIDKKKYEVKKKTTGVTYKPHTFTEYRSTNDIYTFIIDYDTSIQYKDVDTAAILRDYFAKVLVIDTLQLRDSMGYIAITDTISKNRLQYRTFVANVNQKIINDTVWITPKEVGAMYFGINGGFTKNQLPNTIGISLMYNTPTNMMYGIGVGLQNGPAIAPYVNGSVYWKIKLRKNAP